MKTKRFLSILLSLVLVLGMLPGMSLTAYAEGSTTTITPGTDDAKTGTGTMTITLKIKAAQTITADNVTASYGDTDKSVSASVTTPSTGGGTISYAVKEGSGDYISIASDGNLTIKKVPPTDGKAYVIVTAAATDDYAETTKEVTVTISKAEVTITALNQSIMVGGTVPDLSAPVLDTHYSVTGLVGEDTLTTAPTLAYQKNGSAATPDNTTAGAYDIVPSGASAGDNYSVSYTNGTLTISDKGTQTITASDVTATYGDTNKSVSATVTVPETGGGAISYAVKDGSGDCIDVDASTGALTIKKASTATVIVTAEETATYAQATQEVTVTVGKAEVTVTAKAQTVKEGESIDTAVNQAELSGAMAGHALSAVTLTADTDAKTITPSAAEIKDGEGNDVTGNYTVTYSTGALTVIPAISRTVTFKVVNGAWGDGTREDKTVVLTGYEGDELRLTIDDIPQVTKPDEGYEFGSGVWTPDEPPISFQGIGMGDPITEDTTFTFTYGVKTAVSHTLTVSYVYEDQTQAAETYTQAYEEGAEYSVISPVIDGFTPDQDTVSGTMGTEDAAVTVTYHAAQVIPVECDHEAEEIPAVPPTCTKRGSTAGEKCKLCGVILRKPEPVPALGHDYHEKRTQKVEINQEGVVGFICSRCGDTITSYFLMGDVNGDGVVDGRDLLRLARFLAGQDVEIIWQAAEMTGDGEVDGRDLLRLAKYVAGVI